MNRNIWIFWIGICMLGSLAQAGQSGYLLNGKTVITHKDGEPLPTPDEDPKRKPASVQKVQGKIFFDEDELARCYWQSNSSALFCVKK